jgi:hypothetical protein
MSRPRILRLLRIGFSVACGICCLMLMVLWVRSHRQEAVIEYVDSHSRGWHLVSWRGATFLSTADYDVANPGVWRRYVAWEPGILGFGKFKTGRSASVRIPYWFPVLMFAALAMFCAAPWLRWPKRFSLRTLLIATTLVAALLGAIVYAVR